MSATTDPRIARVRELYAAISDHDLDLDTIGSLVTDDCIRHYVRGRFPMAGDHVGRQKVMDSYAAFRSVVADDYRVDIGGINAGVEVVASFHRDFGSRARDKRPLDVEMLVRYRFEGDRIAEIWDYANDVPKLAAFLS
ncbi:MAG: hypothetical protein JWN46_109 [Acidimicrobiales bacterium]|nr:hypothetical protein [Acidimicrobiales bacterium]